jgi:hypothetical protein
VTSEKRQAQRRPLAADAAERIGAIIEAAERAAEAVIDDAEAQAERYLAEARLEADREAVDRRSEQAEWIDSLIEQAESLRGQAELMVGALERVKAQLQGGERAAVELAEPPTELRSGRGSHLSAVADPGAERSDYSGARLLATQMAVSGSSREEIELKLRNGFEIDDPAAILDAILGPEE